MNFGLAFGVSIFLFLGFETIFGIQKIFQKAQNMSTNRNTNLLVINVNS